MVVEHFFQEGLVEGTGTGIPPFPQHCALLDALTDEADLLWRGERTLKETFLPFLHHNFSCVGAKAERTSFYRVSLKSVRSPQPRVLRKRPNAECLRAAWHTATLLRCREEEEGLRNVSDIRLCHELLAEVQEV